MACEFISNMVYLKPTKHDNMFIVDVISFGHEMGGGFWLAGSPIRW